MIETFDHEEMCLLIHLTGKNQSSKLVCL